jgi:hypothetical protein
MIAVAAVALLLGGTKLAYRAIAYRHQIRWHRMMEHSVITSVIEGGKSATATELEEMSKVQSAYHAAMRRKYERAAARPWSEIEPDPPMPIPLSGPGRRVDVRFRD